MNSEPKTFMKILVRLIAESAAVNVYCKLS